MGDEMSADLKEVKKAVAEATSSQAIQDAETKIPQLESAVKEIDGKLLQLKADLKQHKKDRADAKKAIADATAIREKEAAEYSKFSSKFKTNIERHDRFLADFGGFISEEVGPERFHL